METVFLPLEECQQKWCVLLPRTRYTRQGQVTRVAAHERNRDTLPILVLFVSVNQPLYPLPSSGSVLKMDGFPKGTLH